MKYALEELNNCKYYFSSQAYIAIRNQILAEEFTGSYHGLGVNFSVANWDEWLEYDEKRRRVVTAAWRKRKWRHQPRREGPVFGL